LPELAGRDFLREIDPARLRALTATTTSGAGGRFSFDAPPVELGDAPSVLWVTHAGHAAARVAFEDPAAWARRAVETVFRSAGRSSALRRRGAWP
jgi:hypothetical protein